MAIAKWLSSAWKSRNTSCAYPQCSRKRSVASVASSYMGFHLGEEWFCSAECIENSIARKITTDISSWTSQEPRQPRRMPLGLLLVSRGLMSPEQLSMALARQKSERINLGDAVLKMGFVTAEQVTAAVAAQWSCPVFPLGSRSIPIAVHIPAKLLESCEMLPVHFSEQDRKLTLGFVSQVQYKVLSTIESITSCDATPCFITASEFRRGLKELSHEARENELLFDRPVLPTEIAQLSRNYIHQLGGKSAMLGVCKDHVWLRVKSQRQETDLLFRVLMDSGTPQHF